MKWNYTAIMIMSVLGKVCHLILYFPINQGLAINLSWPARKNKQCFELFEVFLTSSADQYFFGGGDDLHLQIIQSISTVLHWIKSSICQQSTVTECIFNWLDPSTAWWRGVGGIITYFYWSCVYKYITGNVWVSALQQRHADFYFKPSGLFLFLNHEIDVCGCRWETKHLF